MADKFKEKTENQWYNNVACCHGHFVNIYPDIIITEPTHIKSRDKSHVYAICECPVSTDYGIVIKKQYVYPSWYRFKCTKCGLEGKVWG